MNKFLEKIAGPYFYDKAKHFAQHADDLKNINARGFKDIFGKTSFSYGGTDKFREVSQRRVDRLLNKAKVRYTSGGTIIGAGLGGVAGHTSKYDEQGRKLSNSERNINATLGAISGGIIGGVAGFDLYKGKASRVMSKKRNTFGQTLENNIFDKKYKPNETVFSKERDNAAQNFSQAREKAWKEEHRKRRQENEDFWKNFNSKYKSNSNSNRRSYGSSSIHDLHKDLEFPEGGFKTKAEATKHYRKMSMKHHPDRGGSTEKMSKLNSAWDKFKKHPDGFEKLAGFGIGNFYVDFFA